MIMILGYGGYIEVPDKKRKVKVEVKAKNNLAKHKATCLKNKKARKAKRKNKK